MRRSKLRFPVVNRPIKPCDRIHPPLPSILSAALNVPLAVLISISFALGITLGWLQGTALFWPWALCAAAFGGVSLFSLRRQFPRVAITLLLLAFVAIGAAWLTLRHHYVAVNDVAARMTDEPALVRVRGIVESSPLVRDTATGSMALYNYRAPASFFRFSIESLYEGGAGWQAARGRLLVKCDETLHSLRPGDLVEMLGWLRRFPEPRNPGEFDRATYARVLGQAGMLTIPQRELVRVIEASRSSFIDSFRRWREQWRTAATGWLLADLPYTDRTERQALLAALLIGERGPDLADLDQSFRHVGLSHLLAISGAHLGVLAGVVLLIFRLVSPPRRWHGLLLIAIVLAYLFLIEARTPVYRAAIMTCAASLGLVFARRLSAGGLVALSAFALLCWSPQQLFDAGFQLSYGVVLGLIFFSAPMRARWFGPRNQLAASTSAMVWEWSKGLAAASIVAWAVATPLVIHHFGMVTPLAALASVIAIPVTSALLAVGYLKMLCGALLPSAGVLLAAPLTVLSDLLISIVQALDALPLSFLSVPKGSAVWTLLALGVICLWFVHSSRALRRVLIIALFALTLWLARPILPIWHKPPLRIDMLSVGDGSCYILRSAGSTVIFDCGSSTDLDAGRSQIVPALEALGVRSVDALVVSHANLDHFSAAIEIAERFRIRRVCVTHQFMRAAEHNSFSPGAYLLEELTQRRAAIEVIARGEHRRFGSIEWTFLHPPADGRFNIVNDSSCVISITAANRRVLLTGDIQREAMAMLLSDPSAIDADVLELPHHGSHHPLAETFVDAVSPQIVLQSTGWSRWERDQWAESLKGVERLVTTRDGACWVEIWDDGAIRTGRFKE